MWWHEHIAADKRRRQNNWRYPWWSFNNPSRWQEQEHDGAVAYIIGSFHHAKTKQTVPNRSVIWMTQMRIVHGVRMRSDAWGDGTAKTRKLQGSLTPNKENSCMQLPPVGCWLAEQIHLVISCSVSVSLFLLGSQLGFQWKIDCILMFAKNFAVCVIPRKKKKGKQMISKCYFLLMTA